MKDFKDAIVLSLQKKSLISQAGVQEIEEGFFLWKQAGMDIFNELSEQLLYVGSYDDLKELCAVIVANFDNNCLELPRKVRQKFKKQLNIQQ